MGSIAQARPQTGSGFSATSRQEFIADILLPTTNTQYMLPTNGGLIPNDRFMYGMFLTFEARMTNANAAAIAAVRADAPFSLIENITVSGYHRVRGQNEPFINLRGVDLYNLMRIYTGHFPYMTPSVNGAPNFTPNLSVVDGDTNDIRFVVYLPFYPMGMPINAQLNWLLDCPNYDQLKMTVTFADALSVFSGQAIQPTFSAFGSATGTPRIRVEGQFALGGSGIFGFIPGRTWRYFQEFTTGDILTNVSNSRLVNIPRGNKIRGILCKTGVKATTATAGNNPYDSYSDNILQNIKVQRGLNKSIRFYPNYFSIKNEVSHTYGMFPQTGYALIDFAQRGRLMEVLDTVGLVAGPSGDTDLYVQGDITGAANQAQLYLFEELRNIPRRIAG